MRRHLACALVLASVRLLGQQYFPTGILGGTKRHPEFAAEWYSGQLTALREPSLWQLSPEESDAEVYRFTWLRAFHAPISVRLIINGDGTGTLISKQTSGNGGYDTGKLIRNTTRRVSHQDVENFRELVQNNGFWALPAKPEESGVLTLDGARWMMEGVNAGKYHVVDRQSPPSNDPVHRIGMMLVITLARFKLLYEDVY